MREEIESKDIGKHPIKYGTEYMREILGVESKEGLIKELTFAIRERMLLVTCKDEESYKTLKNCEKAIDSNYVRRLGLKAIVFQYDKYYLVLKIINEFASKGMMEISFGQVVERVNSYTPARSEEAIKNIMAFYAIDLIEAPWRQSRYPPQLLENRGLKPLVERLKNDNDKDSYQLLLSDKNNNKASSSKKVKS